MLSGPGPGQRVWIAAGITDMRKGMGGLAALVQMALGEKPFSGDVFVFRGRRRNQASFHIPFSISSR